VTLNWTASSSTVVGYNIYRAYSPAGVYARVNSSLATTTQFIDTNVLPGTTYFYAVTSVDSNNVESATSNEASATVPSP
jgi:fibronectin type 3 domain-containing protein